jgi:hypothetical protein
MSQLRKLKYLASACAIASVSAANAQSGSNSSQYYPEASLTQIYSQEQIEQKKADELEQKTIQQRDLYEKQKREVEQQVAAHRYHIEGLKMQQEKAQGELDLLAVDLQHVSGDLASYQAEHQQLDESSKATVAYLQGQRQELADRTKALDTELKSLEDARKKAEKEIYGMAMDIEHYKSDIAKMETKTQEAETKRAGLDADEMKVRGEWMETKMAAAEHMKQRDEAIAQLAETKKRYEQANKELAIAHVEMAKAEKERNDTSKNVATNMAKYEHDIMQANKNRIANEAERIRLESEVAKINEYASRMKESRDQSVEQQTTSEGLVLKSSLALESARTALTQSVADTDQRDYKAEREQHRARGLANAEEASQLVQGGRVWVTTENCKAYSGPNTKHAAGFFDSGKKLLGKDHGSRWVEIVNGSGSSVYVESRCGRYDN